MNYIKRVLKSIHFKNLVVRSSFLSKSLSISLQYQLNQKSADVILKMTTILNFWKKWGSCNCLPKINELYLISLLLYLISLFLALLLPKEHCDSSLHGLLRDTLDFLSTASFSNDDEDAMEEDFEDGECITDTVIFVKFVFNSWFF